MSDEAEVRIAPDSVSAPPLKQSERDALMIDMHSRLARIEVRVEVLPDHEDRIRKVERRIWGVPGSLLVALLAVLGVHVN